MYVSSCQSVDMRIDIVKYEEHLFYCCQNYKKGGYLLLIFLQKLDRRLSQRLQLNRKCNSCSTSFKWQKGQIRRFSGVFGTVCLPVSICKRWLLSLSLFSVFFCDLYWWLCSSNHFCDGHFWILSRILVSCHFLLDYIGVKPVLYV